MRAWVWWSAAAAPVALVGAFLLAQSRQPTGFDPLRDTLSSLAARGAVDPWIMTTGFVLLGACHLATAAGFSAAGVPARVVLAAGGVAVLVVAASPQPATLHAPAAGASFVALAVWPALTGRGLRRLGVPLTLVLAALLVWFVVGLRSGDHVGLSERVVAVSQAVTPLAVVLARRRARVGATARG